MFSFQTKVRYSEINAEGKVPISSIVNYFQDCSTFQSEQIGQGIDALRKKNRGWLLTSWQIEFRRQINFGENIKVGTWPHSFKGLYGARNFILTNEKEEICAVANTLWAFIDTTTGHPAKITKEDVIGYEMEEPFDMVYLPRKIKVPMELQTFESFRIKKDDLDTNHHVNNGAYIRMAEEYLPSHKKVKQMRAEYKKSALYQDMIIPKVSVQDNEYTIALCDEEGNDYAVVQFLLEKADAL